MVDRLMPLAEGEHRARHLVLERKAYIARAVAADPKDPATLIQLSGEAARNGDVERADRLIRLAIDRAPYEADVLALAA